MNVRKITVLHSRWVGSRRVKPDGGNVPRHCTMHSFVQTRKHMQRLRGFTLIEIAVVLFISALVLGGIVQYLTLQLAAAKVTSTKSKQEAIKTAVVNYIARNSQLPCPADPTIANGVAQNGVAAATCAAAAGGITVSPAVTPVVATGSVPWVSLGLSNDASLDGYGSRLTYQVVIAATTLNAQTVSGMKGAIAIHSATPVAAGNKINECTPGTATYNPCAAVLVIVSHGLNGFGSYSDAGILQTAAGGADEAENSNGDAAFVVKAYSDAPANPFDDLVMALTSSDLLSPLTSSGGMQDFRAALSANFNVIKNALISNAGRAGTFLCVAGNCGNSSNCLTPGSTCEVAQYTYTLPGTIPALPASMTTDPWGNAIVYAINTAAAPAGLGATWIISPDTGTSPLSITAFTLTSLGPDVTAANTDDISVTVTVGEFQSLAAKFR